MHTLPSANKEQSPEEKGSSLLSEYYYKAHRSYMIASGLLLSWSLIGLEIKQKPIDSYNVIIKSTNAFPIIIAIVTIYFAYKITIEWFQCSKVTRKKIPSKIDFLVAQLIGTTSITIYTYQTITEKQLIDLIPSYFFLYLVLLIFSIISAINIALSVNLILLRRKAGEKWDWQEFREGTLSYSTAIILIFIFFIFFIKISQQLLLSYFIILILTFSLCFIVIKDRFWEKKDS